MALYESSRVAALDQTLASPMPTQAEKDASLNGTIPFDMAEA